MCVLVDAAAGKRENSAQFQPTIVLRDTVQLYNLFDNMETYLKDPRRFELQRVFAFDAATRHFLLQSYYGYDEDILREILGKQLSRSLRKDLDDVAEKTNVQLRSCRRQVEYVYTLLVFILRFSVRQPA